MLMMVTDATSAHVHITLSLMSYSLRLVAQLDCKQMQKNACHLTLFLGNSSQNRLPRNGNATHTVRFACLSMFWTASLSLVTMCAGCSWRSFGSTVLPITTDGSSGGGSWEEAGHARRSCPSCSRRGFLRDLALQVGQLGHMAFCASAMTSCCDWICRSQITPGLQSA